MPSPHLTAAGRLLSYTVILLTLTLTLPATARAQDADTQPDPTIKPTPAQTTNAEQAHTISTVSVLFTDLLFEHLHSHRALGNPYRDEKPLKEIDLALVRLAPAKQALKNILLSTPTQRAPLSVRELLHAFAITPSLIFGAEHAMAIRDFRNTLLWQHHDLVVSTRHDAVASLFFTVMAIAYLQVRPDLFKPDPVAQFVKKSFFSEVKKEIRRRLKTQNNPKLRKAIYALIAQIQAQWIAELKAGACEASLLNPTHEAETRVRIHTPPEASPRPLRIEPRNELHEQLELDEANLTPAPKSDKKTQIL